VIDHVTGLQDRTLCQILRLEELPAQKNWGMATQQQYGQSTQQCKEICRALFSMDCNVVIVGQQRYFKPEGPGTELLAPTWGVDVSPSFAQWLQPAADYIVRTFKRQRTVTEVVEVGGERMENEVPTRGVDFCLQVAPDPFFTTKFRLAPTEEDLPEYIVNPTYDKIAAVIRGEYEAAR
jgi:hypothetical protein